MVQLHGYHQYTCKKKSEFSLEEITFLGFHISKNGIKPTETRCREVLEFRKPESVTEVKSFLGMVQFSASFIPDLATLSEPLRRLTRDGVPYHWGMEQKEAFKKLKGKVADATALGFFTKDAKTTVVADASPVGLGAVLIQGKKEEVPRAIRYASKALSDVEKRYTQTEKEALALVWACENFQIYLLGMEFDLITDHKPLEVIFEPRSKPSARIERWVLRMQPFHYKVIYKSGKSNIADPLSRLLNVS